MILKKQNVKDTRHSAC